MSAAARSFDRWCPACQGVVRNGVENEARLRSEASAWHFSFATCCEGKMVDANAKNSNRCRHGHRGADPQDRAAPDVSEDRARGPTSPRTRYESIRDRTPARGRSLGGGQGASLAPRDRARLVACRQARLTCGRRPTVRGTPENQLIRRQTSLYGIPPTRAPGDQVVLQS